ncbi:MAG: aconitase family protein, partial [Pseudomonadota bacterium]
STIEGLDMEQRMTVCNMSIEAGARAGMIAPDQKTFDYLRGRPLSPEGEAFDAAAERWQALRSDEGATFDREVKIDAADIAPTITYGTHPGMVVPITEMIPAPADASEEKALEYMGLDAGQSMIGTKVDVVFVGSCTNSRISDLRAAAAQLKGRKVHPDVTMLVVPGSEQVYRAAEHEGLHQIFIDAGAQWRLPGCSMCLSMNGDIVPDGALAISTSNRNFEGRQGPGSRTLLASPAAAAAAAVAGCVADPRINTSEAA